MGTPNREAGAIVGVHLGLRDLGWESIQIGQGASMLMVSASRTAVKL